MENKNNLMSFGLILGLALVLSAIIGSYTFYNLRSQDFITTTGSAKKAVTSDKVKWITSITRPTTITNIKDGYAKMDADLKEVKAFFVASGIPETEITIAPIWMNEVYEQYPSGDKKYNLTQNIEINSSEVAKIDNLSKNTNSLIINKGILFSTSSLEYYYSQLPAVRVELLADAVLDAKARAQKLAEAGGKKVGTLKSASSGVVQVLSPNSIDVSDYGMYNTSTIEKEIMITVKGSFQIK